MLPAKAAGLRHPPTMFTAIRTIYSAIPAQKQSALGLATKEKAILGEPGQEGNGC